MKRTALALALASLAVAPGMAADLPSRAPPPVYVPPAPIFTWTGFYIGGNAGVAFGGRNSVRNLNQAGFTDVNGNNSSNRNDIGFTGGGQIGYNYQIGSIVLGIEADAQYLDRGNSNNNLNLPGNNQYQVQQGKNDNFFGTARGRIGYSFDRLLIYATGGLAYGGAPGATTVTFGPATTTQVIPANVFVSNRRSDNIGFTIGGGLEYAIFGNWSIKGEYLYTSLGDNTLTFTNNGTVSPATGVTSFQGKLRNEFSVARIGLNYKF